MATSIYMICVRIFLCPDTLPTLGTILHALGRLHSPTMGGHWWDVQATEPFSFGILRMASTSNLFTMVLHYLRYQPKCVTELFCLIGSNSVLAVSVSCLDYTTLILMPWLGPL